jgi:glycine cleavage system aminomethyltransferase T
MWFAPEGVKAEYQFGYNKTDWFEHWKNEHEAIRNAVGLVDLSPFCKIQVEGANAEKVLQRICTNHVGVKPGRVVYTQWLNERAGIEADVTERHPLSGHDIGRHRISGTKMATQKYPGQFPGNDNRHQCFTGHVWNQRTKGTSFSVCLYRIRFIPRRLSV